MTHLEEIALTIDEIEAIRLADFEELYHEDAAKKMKISRQTFGRILQNAHRKVAESLIQGKALKIETEIGGQNGEGKETDSDISMQKYQGN